MDTWGKFPSARSGGKAFFYVRHLNGNQVTVVWDRLRKSWVIIINDKKFSVYFSTAKEAKDFIDIFDYKKGL